MIAKTITGAVLNYGIIIMKMAYTLFFKHMFINQTIGKALNAK